jgi:hypothetical protein
MDLGRGYLCNTAVVRSIFCFVLWCWSLMQNAGLTICWDELPHSWRNPTTALHELHLGHDDVVLQHRPTVRAYCIAPSLIEVDLGTTTVLAYAGSHVCGVCPNKPVSKEDNLSLLCNVCYIIVFTHSPCNVLITPVGHHWQAINIFVHAKLCFREYFSSNYWNCSDNTWKTWDHSNVGHGLRSLSQQYQSQDNQLANPFNV